jgi:hypothetical protein
MFIVGRKSKSNNASRNRKTMKPVTRAEKIRTQKEVEYQNKVLRENYQMLKLSKINREAAEGVKDGIRLLSNDIKSLEEYKYYGDRDEAFEKVYDLMENVNAFVEILMDANCAYAVIDEDDEDFGRKKSDEDYLRDYEYNHPEDLTFDDFEDYDGFEDDASYVGEEAF